MKPVSVLLIGLGRVGSRFYEKFRELGESRVRLVGVCEIDERHPLLQRAREGGVRVYENFEEALAPSENPVDIILDTTNIPDVKTRSAIGLKKPETAIRCFFRWSLPIFSGIWPLPGKTCRRIMCNPVTDLPGRDATAPGESVGVIFCGKRETIARRRDERGNPFKRCRRWTNAAVSAAWRRDFAPEPGFPGLLPG